MGPKFTSIDAVKGNKKNAKPELWAPSDFELMYNNILIMQQDEEEAEKSNE